MIDHGYTVKKTKDETIDRNLNGIKDALDILAKSITPVQTITFVSLGSNGVGNVALVPPKMPNGTQALYRALIGMRLVAAIDLSTSVSLQTSFEQMLSFNDSIKQLSSTNLSARSILFVLQSN